MILSMSQDTGLGPKEIESASLTLAEAAEAAVIPGRHEVKEKNLICTFP